MSPALFPVSPEEPPYLHNRVAAIMLHIPWYTFRGQVRLAKDAGVSKSAVSRMLGGKCMPSYRVMIAVTEALSRRLGKPLALSEVFASDKEFGESACELCGCRGCLPTQAYAQDDTLQPAYQNVQPGAWSLTVSHSRPALKSG